MARLRLFGPAAEAAGTSSDSLAGSDVDEVLALATERYGNDFAAVLKSCRIWVNGDVVASGAQRVGPGDEVAVLPPVSGG